MNKTIMCPLDGSGLSEQALPFARMLAPLLGLDLHVVHVHEPHTTWIDNLPLVDEVEDAAVQAEERQYLASLCLQRAGMDGQSNITTALLEGSCVLALVREIHRVRPAFVVMLTHGRGGFTRFWLGSVADTLLRISPVPILLQRPAVPHEPALAGRLQTILIPYDGSPRAEALVHDVVSRFEPLGCRYVLVRVLEPRLPIGYGPTAYGEYLPYTVGPHMVALAEQSLAKVAEPLRSRGLSVQTEVAVASPVADAIRAMASTYQADLIAMGTHGRGALARTLLGGIADKVIRGSSLPVLVYGPAVDHLTAVSAGDAAVPAADDLPAPQSISPETARSLDPSGIRRSPATKEQCVSVDGAGQRSSV